MFANIINQIDLGNSEIGFITDTKVMGFGYSCDNLDVEVDASLASPDPVSSFVASLPPDTKVRIISRTLPEHILNEQRGARAKALEGLGNIAFETNIFLEKAVGKINFLKSESAGIDAIRAFRDSFDPKLFKHIGLNLKPLSDYSEFFKQPTVVKLASCGLQINSNFYGVLKLVKLGTYPIDLYDVIAARDKLPIPNTYSFTMRKLSDSETQIFLKKKSKQEASGSDLTSFKKFEDVQNSIVQADLGGRRFVEFEVNIVFESDDDKELLRQLFDARNTLKGIGQFEVEIVGVLPSIEASRVGGPTHHSNIERDDNVQTYMPFYQLGNNVTGAVGKRAFTFHRANNTLASLDPYTSSYMNYSGVIIGQSGRGKSVFNNMLIKCLLNDEKCKIILVDVMGSYTNLVNRMGGNVNRINSSEPSGISPMEFLNASQAREVVEIVLDYLEKLLLEDDETSLRRSEQVELEKAFLSYVESQPKSFSIDGFLAFSKDIPRKTSLERWRSKGILGNIFAPFQKKNDSKIQYFDFTEITGASNGPLAKAVMSAVMAHFSFLLLSKQTDEKLIFLCDETPFFVKNCFSSFTLLSKNVRKLSGSLILTAQMLSDLVVNGDGSLISQSEFKILFSCDGTDEFFKTYSGVSDDTLADLKSLRPVRGEYSLFFFKDGLGERLCKLWLSKDEYYTSSTHADDRTLLKKTKEFFNFKDEDTTITAISLLKEANLI